MHEKNSFWLVAIADCGILVDVRATAHEAAAWKSIATFLENHGYQGPDEKESIELWLSTHDERLSVLVRQQESLVDFSDTREQPTPSDQFVENGGIVVLSRNPNPHDPDSIFNACAYQNMPDIISGISFHHGFGSTLPDALEALDIQLSHDSAKP
jgi:hypothetical protein